jgi:hypothetical protein
LVPSAFSTASWTWLNIFVGVPLIQVQTGSVQRSIKSRFAKCIGHAWSTWIYKKRGRRLHSDPSLSAGSTEYTVAKTHGEELGFPKVGDNYIASRLSCDASGEVIIIGWGLRSIYISWRYNSRQIRGEGGITRDPRITKDRQLRRRESLPESQTTINYNSSRPESQICSTCIRAPTNID